MRKEKVPDFRSVGTAVVTGGGTGIGKAVVERLVGRGLTVYLLGRNVTHLKAVADEVGKGVHRGVVETVQDGIDARDRADALGSGEAEALQGRCIPLQVDVTDTQSVKTAFEKIGSVSIFVANAGICEQAGLLDANADAVFEKVMRTNVYGVWDCFRALAPRFVYRGSAVVVSSGLGKLGRGGYGAYCASKHAVLGLVKCFAKELAPRQITVNAVCPGWVDTQMAQKDIVKTAKTLGTTPAVVVEQALAGIPLRRFVQPEEVASLIDWLTSDSARAITGQSYNISCGEFVG